MAGRMRKLNITPKQESCQNESDNYLEAARLRASLERRVDEFKGKMGTTQVNERHADFVAKALENAYIWTRHHTKTYNEHWKREGRVSPLEPFPRDSYLIHVFEILDTWDVVWWEKSRDMMLSWACVAYLTFQAMKTPYCGILFQAQKDQKVIQLVDYAKHLYRNSDPRIKEAYPLAKGIERQSDHELNFANGSSIIGIPGGAHQIRSYHPYGYLNDESSFQPDAGECYNEALAAVAGKIIFNSSAGPGWYSDARKGVVRNQEE